ncbi:FABP family protein [Leifsonia kafniensis]|uniref:Peroxynitrite isomerase n=1 Tax=Leifsonia kafniensis TaxID=475957 RepID=A0ABP7KXW7_9MICO
MIELPVGLPPELVPLSWLIGVWEGSGVLDYSIGDDTVTREFGHRLSFSHDGLPYLNYSSYTWLEPEEGSDSDEKTPLATETGYWRLHRPQGDGDPGPGLLPALGAIPFNDAEAVETLRNDSGGFDIEVTLVHPGGVAELYLGQVAGPRIDLATDAVVRSETAKPYSAATRLYGLVENHLLWAWDIAALGQTLRTHASGRLARVE